MAYDPFSTKAADDFLDKAAPAAKWPKIGYVVEGTVTSYEMAQCTDYDSGEPLFWEGDSRVVESKAEDKSRPVMQLVMGIQGKPTGETWEGLQNVRKELPDDDGARTLYIKGLLRTAITTALRAKRAKPQVGAYIKVTRIVDGPKTNPKFAAPHNYTAEWTPAGQNPEAVADFMQDSAEENPFG